MMLGGGGGFSKLLVIVRGREGKEGVQEASKGGTLETDVCLYACPVQHQHHCYP